MDIIPQTSFRYTMLGKITKKDYYKTEDGTQISKEKGSGSIEISDDNVIKIYDAKKVSIYGNKEDKKIIVSESQVDRIMTNSGKNQVYLAHCTFKPRSLFSSSQIITGQNGILNNKDNSDVIRIDGDFEGLISAQQGSGSAYGDDKSAHKDTIIINGDNKGRIEIDTHDKVQVKGEKGQIANTSVIMM